MLSHKGRIYSFGSLTLAGLVASLVGVATQSTEAGLAAATATSIATQSGILSVLQNKGSELTIKLLENLGAISLNLGTDDARQLLIKVAESLNKSDGEQNHDIAKAVRQAILSIIESEKEEIEDKDDIASLEEILKTTEETWAWVELLEQDNLLTISEEKIPHFFAVKAEDIAKTQSPVKESQWKLFLLEIAGKNSCTLTQKSLNQISASLYKKFPQSLREVFAQDFANEGVAYGKLLLALVGNINARQDTILDFITDVSQTQDKYQLEIREWFKTILFEIRNPLDYSSKTLKQAVLAYLMKVADKTTELNKIYPPEFHNKNKKSTFFNDITQRVQVVKKEQFDIYKLKLDEKARLDGTFREEIDKKIYDQRGFEAEMFQRETQERIEIYEWNDKTRKDFKRNVILGDPGLGKSWLLNFEANKLANEAIQILQNAPDTPAETAKALKSIKIPIHLRLADIAGEAKKSKELALTISELASFDEKINDERKSLTLYLKEIICKRKNAVLLLDALDEVPEDSDKSLTRKQIAEKISDFAKEYQEISILLTSRKVNYEAVNLHNAKQTLSSDNNLEILAFDETQIKNYVAGWFGKDSQTTEIFLNLLENQSQTAGLSQNPLMLSLMCRLFYEKQAKITAEEAEKHFPDSRCEIYGECLQGLLKDWKDKKRNKMIVDEEIADKIAILEETAFHLFSESAEQFTIYSFREKLRVALGIDEKTDRRTKETLAWLEEFEADGLLVETTKGEHPQYRFIHLTFQEYLTASYLAKMPDWKHFIFEKYKNGLQNKILFNPDWQHTLQLLGGKLSAADAKDYIETFLQLNGKNGEVDMLFRPFILANFVAKEASNKLVDDYKIELMENLIDKYNNPLDFQIKETFILTLQNWGIELVNYLLLYLDRKDVNQEERGKRIEFVKILSILNIGKKKIVENILKQHIEEKKYQGNSYFLTEALGNIKDIPIEFAEEILKQFIEEKNINNDIFSLAGALRNIKDIPFRFVENILKQFIEEKGNDNARYSLAKALSNIKNIPIEFAEEIFKQIIEEKDNPGICSFLTQSFGNIKDIPSEFIEKLLKQFIEEKNNESARSSLARALMYIKGIPVEFAEEILKQIIEEKDDDIVRSSLAWALMYVKEIPVAIAEKILKQIIEEKDDKIIRLTLAIMLGNIKDISFEFAEKILKQIIEEKDDTVRSFLTQSLGNNKDIPSEFIEKLLKQIIEEKDNRDKRCVLTDTLGDFKEIPIEFAEEILKQIIEEKDNHNARYSLSMALNNVKEIPVEFAEEILKQFIEEKDNPGICIYLVQALSTSIKVRNENDLSTSILKQIIIAVRKFLLKEKSVYIDKEKYLQAISLIAVRYMIAVPLKGEIILSENEK